jgi:hypothetical protein
MVASMNQHQHQVNQITNAREVELYGCDMEEMLGSVNLNDEYQYQSHGME